MDPDIIKVKNLLEEGYIIFFISISFKAAEPKNLHEVKVELKKGETSQFIHSINSSDFLSFILHFKSVRDKPAFRTNRIKSRNNQLK